MFGAVIQQVQRQLLDDFNKHFKSEYFEGLTPKQLAGLISNVSKEADRRLKLVEEENFKLTKRIKKLERMVSRSKK